MKPISLFLSILLIAQFACVGLGSTRSTPPSVQTDVPAVVASLQASSTLKQALSPQAPPTPEIASTSHATGTPEIAALDTPTPTLAPMPLTISPDNISSLAQLHTFRPISANNLLSLMSKLGPGGAIPPDLQSSLLPPAYLSIAYSPDGLTLALGGCTALTGGAGYACLSPYKPILRLMDARTGEIKHELQGHTSSITGLAFLPDGKTLVSVSEAKDGSIRFWDVNSGTSTHELKINSKNGAPGLAISPDGSKLVAAWYQNFRVWDINTDKVLAQGVSANGIPQFSKDGSLLAVYGSNNRSSIAIYDTATWNQINKINVPSITIQYTFSPDGKTLVTGDDSSKSTIHFWDVATGNELGHFDDDIAPDSMAFSPDGKLLFVGGLPKNSKVEIPLKMFSVWDPATRQRIAEPHAPAISPLWLTVSSDGTHIAYTDVSGTVSIWGLPDEEINAARQVLMTYLDDLNQKNYADAAALYYNDRIDPSSADYQYLKQSRPNLDLNNLQAVLKASCEDKRFPCGKLRDIVYQGYMNQEGIVFFVEYAAPDGSALVSPIPCSKIPSTCKPITSFMFNLVKGNDGAYKSASLPPAAEFP